MKFFSVRNPCWLYMEELAMSLAFRQCWGNNPFAKRCLYHWLALALFFSPNFSLALFICWVCCTALSGHCSRSVWAPHKMNGLQYTYPWYAHYHHTACPCWITMRLLTSWNHHHIPCASGNCLGIQKKEIDEGFKFPSFGIFLCLDIYHIDIRL